MGEARAREKVNLDVQIPSLEIYVDDFIVETPYMSALHAHIHTPRVVHPHDRGSPSSDEFAFRVHYRIYTFERERERERTARVSELRPVMIFCGYHAKKYTRREFLARAGNILSRRLKAYCCPSRCIVTAIRRSG